MSYHKKNRPVYLNLLKIRLPIGGVVSITHRVTGVLLVLLLPVSVYLLQVSVDSESGFNRLAALFSTLPARVVMLFCLWLFAQHFFSGLRHLLLDLDIGISKTAARSGAWLTVAGSLLAVVLLAFGLLS